MLENEEEDTKVPNQFFAYISVIYHFFKTKS